MIRIDRPLLHELGDIPPNETTPPQASRTVRRLGPLAPWWLHPRLLEKAGEHTPAYRTYRSRPSLPSSPGSCWIIFALKDRLPGLRDALLLPLQWRRDTPHGRNLPVALQQLADTVIGQLDAEQAAASSRWGLHLHPDAGLNDVELSGLNGGDLGVDSGWASLAGGLRLAAEGLCADTKVWASAAWHRDFGIGRVDSLPAKLELARDWGACKIFVPAENQTEALEWAEGHPSSLYIQPLLPVGGNPDARVLLRTYLQALRVPPDAAAPWRQRREYYASADRRVADEFHWNCLLGDIIKRCQARLVEEHPTCRPTHLVTVVSASKSVIALAPRVFQVRHCLLLYERGEAKIADACRDVHRRLSDAGIRCVPREIDLGKRASELDQLRACLGEFAGSLPSERLAVDLTPGYKPLSLALDELAPQASWRLYLRHKQSPPDNRPDPGTEYYDCWQGSPDSL